MRYRRDQARISLRGRPRLLAMAAVLECVKEKMQRADMIGIAGKNVVQDSDAFFGSLPGSAGRAVETIFQRKRKYGLRIQVGGSGGNGLPHRADVIIFRPAGARIVANRDRLDVKAFLIGELRR